MEKIESLIKDLPDPDGAKRFFSEFESRHPSQTKRVLKNHGLLSDILTISSFSPLLATTLLQNPGYASWLARERKNSGVKDKEELLESLARFASTNSSLETHVLLARFRRRELIRIYLKDIRRLGTITEITEEISNLADSILEYALGIARQELDNKFGTPQEIDEKERSAQARFCVVALGKLGSKELNYSSDIDLLFLFSANGSTSGQGTRGSCTNKQYFVKLAETTAKLVGDQSGEGAAYRVDMRLRPHGRVGALAITVAEAVKYYRSSAQMWEKQVLIRSRAAAGDYDVFQSFIDSTISEVFSADANVEIALGNVRRSKEKIDMEKLSRSGFDVKLGKGGIREIEFIAQALQLAFGGKDPWLRSPHTLISLSRLADRGHITEQELTALFDAYDFLRRLEHNVQMEHGLQTHRIPDEPSKRQLISKRIGIDQIGDFDGALKAHTNAVDGAFSRIFGEDYLRQSVIDSAEDIHTTFESEVKSRTSEIEPILASIAKSDFDEQLSDRTIETIQMLTKAAPPLSEMLARNPALISFIPDPNEPPKLADYGAAINEAIGSKATFAEKLGVLRKMRARFIVRLVSYDVFGKLDLHEIKSQQTALAESCIEAARSVTRRKLEEDFAVKLEPFEFGILGLGKLGGGGLDYASDLDLVLIFDDKAPCPVNDLTPLQFYSKAAEIFVATLSNLTRDGSLYRVDLRLRPDGKNGQSVSGRHSLVNYLGTRAAIWEWLAYVKLRGLGDPGSLGPETEKECRKMIHNAASKTDESELREETRRIRKRLEIEKSKSRKGSDIDIKYGEGGLQDVYFSIRYLQLRDNVPDSDEDRSTEFSLQRLYENDSLERQDFENLSSGYEFLSSLDHEIRLAVGRSTILSLSNKKALRNITERLKFESTESFLEALTQHRLNIHASFERIVGT